MARLFDNWLKAYAQYTRHSESPDLFHFWTGVSTIAAVLRRQVWIDQRYFQWTPNFYVVLVGPPGVAAKSTSISVGLSMLEEISTVHIGPNSVTWQALTEALSQATELVPFGDGFRSMSAITCFVKELGTFLRPEDKEMMDVLIDLWDGQIGVWRRGTRHVGNTHIENPWINMIGCTTPSWLQANIPEAMVGGGLVSRIVFVYADKKRHLVAYPADLVKQDEFTEDRKRLIHDLNEIAKVKGAYELTPEAKAWGVKWYKLHWTKRPEHMISERYGGYIARKQTHIHKLAIVLAAARTSELRIDLADLVLADRVTTSLESSMKSVFQSIGLGDVSRHVTEILAYVRAYGEITSKELWRHMMPIMGPKEFDEATGAAIKAGYIKLRQYASDIIYYAVKEDEEVVDTNMPF